MLQVVKTSQPRRLLRLALQKSVVLPTKLYNLAVNLLRLLGFINSGTGTAEVCLTQKLHDGWVPIYETAASVLDRQP